ncbi:hypothetical protein QWZ06_04805 [Chryseobacterium tructae]|uniref:Tetratricopeptide repeat protein n=1 Tax=Chryseobacterium tructae TaxID=1037380 RepID=A0ABV7XTG6_9FLAO|nr:hypothetical protein [Chryseobacterium tructae]MDN3691618.1 hypothetical protein [Chryseobacterium tructae]
MKYILIIITSFVFFNSSCKEKKHENVIEKNATLIKNNIQVSNSLENDNNLNPCKISTRNKDLILECNDKQIIYRDFIINEMSVSTEFIRGDKNNFTLLYELNASTTKVKEKYDFIYSDSGIELFSKEIIKFGRDGILINRIYFDNYNLDEKKYEDLETLGSDLEEKFNNDNPKAFIYDSKKHLLGEINYKSSIEDFYINYPNVNNISLEITNVENANNQAYNLQQMGANNDSKLLLDNIVKQFPNRVVAWLNLGDVNWELNEKTKAKEAYSKYISLMKSQNKNLSKIPQRVYERSK